MDYFSAAAAVVYLLFAIIGSMSHKVEDGELQQSFQFGNHLYLKHTFLKCDAGADLLF